MVRIPQPPARPPKPKFETKSLPAYVSFFYQKKKKICLNHEFEQNN